MFGYNHAGLRVYKNLAYNWRDTCETGGIESFGMMSLDIGEPPLTRYCTFWDTLETRYIRSISGNTLMKDTHGNDNDVWYIYAGDDRIAMVDNSDDVHYYLIDHLGTTRATIRDDGTVTGKQYEYYAFGDMKKENVSLNQEYKYTGKPLDDELGLD
ncbi:MAG: hypothetical protein ABIJ45_02795, partial [Candidatus Zixiibacteriota bacterium]